MVFVGLVGIKDPARPEVAPAIEACGTAGIRVVMITGDTQPTARPSLVRLESSRMGKKLQIARSQERTSSP